MVTGTIFPIPLGQAASWDLEAIEKADQIAAMEASAEGINWTFAPMVDIARDPAGEGFLKGQEKMPGSEPGSQKQGSGVFRVRGTGTADIFWPV